MYVDFSGGVLSPVYIPSTLVVEDEAVQKALEKTNQFGVKFEVAKTFGKTTEGGPDPVIEPKTPKNSGGTPIVKVPQITKVQSAITHLIKKGADPDSLDTADDVLRVSKDLGLEFPNLKTD